MKTILGVIAIVLAAVPIASTAQTSDELKLGRDIVDTQKNLMVLQKKMVVLQNMDMTAQEKSAFWPIYDEFQKELNKLDERTLKLIKEYARNYEQLSDDKAHELISDFLDVEQARIELKKKYLKNFQKALPKKKVARYYQIENKLEAKASLELSQEIPLMK